MDRILEFRVRESRRLLRNPYAHIEYLEELETVEVAEVEAMAVDQQIRASRELLCDPYAYLNDSGDYTAVVSSGHATTVRHRIINSSSEPPRAPFIGANTSRRYTNQQIEARVKQLHEQLWRERTSIWNGSPPSDPIDLLDPAKALGLFGYDFTYDEELGQYSDGDINVEVAGIIDRASKTIHVSRQFPMNVRTFTAAHELGHAMLHPSGGGVHRDKALDGAKLSRDPDEYAADKVAALFLLPAKLVRSRFSELFNTECFALTDDSAFALSCTSISEVQRKCPSRRDISRLLASAGSYSGRNFPTLADQFRVSIEVMAIRLEELSLIER